MSENKEINIDYWDDKWEKNTIMWHKNENHQ